MSNMFAEELEFRAEVPHLSNIFNSFGYTHLGMNVKLNDDIIDELLYFAETKFPQKTIEDSSNNKLTFALLFKRSNETLTGNIDDVVLQMVYGNSRIPPGDDKSPAIKLRKVHVKESKPKDWEEILEDERNDIAYDNILLGVWAPPNSLSKATVLKLLFPNLSGPFKMPDLKEVPLHVALAYDFFKAKDIFDLSDKYPGKVISVGYFSSDVPGEAKLLGKTAEKFEARSAPVTYEEKIIIQLAKDDPQCFMDFIDLGPSYMSTDVEVGELDCAYFFPPGYNKPEAEIITYLKKKTKRKGKMGKFKLTDQLQDDAQSAITGTDGDVSVMDVEYGEETMIGDEGNMEGESEEDEGEEEEKHDEEGVADKATSPVVAEATIKENS